MGSTDASPPFYLSASTNSWLEYHNIIVRRKTWPEHLNIQLKNFKGRFRKKWLESINYKSTQIRKRCLIQRFKRTIIWIMKIFVLNFKKSLESFIHVVATNWNGKRTTEIAVIIILLDSYLLSPRLKKIILYWLHWCVPLFLRMPRGHWKIMKMS